MEDIHIMTKIDETIEEALPILTIDEFRQAVQAVETLRHRRPQTEDEWREEIVRSGIRLNREAKDLLATELASASIQVQDAWFQRKWERERQAAIEARKQAETLALLNKHPLNQRAEELLRIERKTVQKRNTPHPVRPTTVCMSLP